MTLAAQQSRVDALIRMAGLITLAFGIAMIYLTFANSGSAGVAPEIVTIDYSLGILLSLVGALASFAKFK